MIYEFKQKIESLKRVPYDKSTDQCHPLQTLKPEDLDHALYDWFSQRDCITRDLHVSLDKCWKKFYEKMKIKEPCAFLGDSSLTIRYGMGSVSFMLQVNRNL
jgi:hypothetical protein